MAADAPRARLLGYAAALCLLLGGALLWHGSLQASSTTPAIVASHSGLDNSTGARAALLDSVAATDPAYRVSTAPGGLRAVNERQHLRVTFNRGGVALETGSLRLHLALRSVAEAKISEASPQSQANRVLYAHAGVEEWYLNGPQGLEQGFTIPNATGATEPLTLSLAIGGNADARLDGASILLHAGRAALRYGGLQATDAGGRRLHTWLELAGSTILLRVDTHGARYPLRLDPLIQQGSKLVAEGEGGEGLFGYSVALSADGNTALVGARRSGGTGGAAWVFARSGTAWTQQGPALSGSEESEEGGETCKGEGGECGFGRSVALSADGNTALIGAPADSGRTGAVWVFTRSGSVWSQQGSELLAAEETAGGSFGRSLALSGDGDTAIVGGPADHSHHGAVWVFARSGSVWSQQGAKLTGAEEQGEGYFGHSVALSESGGTALIGAPGDGESAGAVWIFERSGTAWVQQGTKHVPGEEQGEGRFGYSAALSADGHTALVGGRRDNNGAGAAWVFSLSGSSWEQQGGKLTGEAGEAGEDAEFGYSVALAGDGDAALIGAPREDARVGAAWSFTRSGSSWLGQELTGPEESGKGWFGSSAALSFDGATAFIGGSHDNGKAGAAWAFLDSSIQSPGEEAGQQSSGTTTGGGTGATSVSKLLGAGGVLSSTVTVLPPPKLGVSGNLKLLAGRVRVRLPGSRVFVPLLGLKQVPFGTIVDATHGKVAVTTARLGGGTQRMIFYAGEFKLTQRRNGRALATLTGASFAVCPTARERRHSAHASASHASRKHVVQKLWAEGHGSYSTKGSYASGAVLGTRWLTEDLCDGTLIRVATDKVAVTNLVTHRRLVVRAGHSYLAKAP